MKTHHALYAGREKDNGAMSQINCQSPGCIYWSPVDDQTISFIPVTWGSLSGSPTIEDAISGSGWTGVLIGTDSDNGGQLLVHSVVGTISQGTYSITGPGWSIDTQNAGVYLNRGLRDIINGVGYMGAEAQAAVWNSDMSLNIKSGGFTGPSTSSVIPATSLQAPGTSSVFIMHIGRAAEETADSTRNKMFCYGYVGSEHGRLFSDRFQYRGGSAPSSGYTDDGAVTPILSNPSRLNIVSGGLIDRVNGVIQHWIDGVIVGEERLPENLTDWTVVDNLDYSANVLSPYDTHHYHASVHTFNEIPWNIGDFMLETKELVLAQTSEKGERAIYSGWATL